MKRAMDRLPDNKLGRPSIYEPQSHPLLAHKYALLGATNEKIAEFFNITVITFENWMRWYIDFFRAVMSGRDIADANVAQSLYNRAVGFEFTEKIYERVLVKDAKGDVVTDPETGERMTELVLKRKMVKHQPADVTAAKFWLWNRTKNNKPEEQWNERYGVDLRTPDGPAAVIILPPKQEITP